MQHYTNRLRRFPLHTFLIALVVGLLAMGETFAQSHDDGDKSRHRPNKGWHDDEDRYPVNRPHPTRPPQRPNRPGSGGNTTVRPTPGRPGSWRYLGAVTADHRADRDIIRVKGADVFRSLKFKVTTAPLRLHRMRVVYENGSKQDISLRAYIPRGGESRVINLRGNRRRIRHIEFWYESKGFNRARVTVFGRK